MKDQTTEISDTNLGELSHEEQNAIRKIRVEQDFSFRNLSPELSKKFDEDYVVCDIEIASPQDRKRMREEFEQEFKSLIQ